MSRYFSEAMNDHPEFQRLKQRIRELEKENQELKQMYVESSTGHFWKAEFERSLKDFEKMRDRHIALMEECLKFNKMSFIRKAFYSFHPLETVETKYLKEHSNSEKIRKN